MRGLWRRFSELVRPGQLDRELADELAQHVELTIAHKQAAGLDIGEARRQALAELGGVRQAREQVAAGRTGFVLEQTRRELAHAARVLRRAPGTTLLSVLTMGAGIGVATLLFALVDAVVLRPLPYPDAEQLVRIFDVNHEAGIARTGVASGNIDDWRERAGVFAGIAGYYAVGRTLSTGTEAEVLITAQVSDDFFDLLRVAPLIGRAFSADEFARGTFNSAAAPSGADPVVMLSHGVWQQRFGGDPSVVGRTIQLERQPFRIVGVMPAHFAMPDERVQLWLPWNVSIGRPRDQHYLGAVARLAPGVSLAHAEERLNGVARELAEQYPATNRGWEVRLTPLREEMVGGTATVLWVLLAAVTLVLLVACANLALLALIRGLDRTEETAVRLALGASATRLLREFLFESAWLAFAGGMVGAGLAAVGLALLPRFTTDLPRLHEVTLDARVFAFILVVTVLAALVAGLPQAWRRTRVAPLEGIASGRRSTASADRHRLRDVIVVAQVAVAVVLMVGSGLLLRSFAQLRATAPGFDPRGVIVAPIFLDNLAYDSGEKTRVYYRRVFEQLAALPGVTGVGAATTVPTSPLGPDFARPVWPEGEPDLEGSTPASVRMVTPGYFAVMGMRVVAGRPFDERDTPQSPRTLMISETLARRLWPGQRAVGRRLVVDYSTAGTYPYEIVGVVGDLRFGGPRSEPLAEIYLPHAQRSYLVMNVVVKTAGDPGALMPSVRAALKAVDPQIPPHGVYLLEDLVGATYARDRQAMLTLSVFAAGAIFLAVLGVYGVLSQRVRERTREIGIRMAMGANRPNVIAWVARSGLRLLAAGLALGMLGAWRFGAALEALLFGVTATDLPTIAGVMLTLAIVSTLAVLFPAWRATRIDPVQVLRRS